MIKKKDNCMRTEEKKEEQNLLCYVLLLGGRRKDISIAHILYADVVLCTGHHLLEPFLGLNILAEKEKEKLLRTKQIWRQMPSLLMPSQLCSCYIRRGTLSINNADSSTH